MFKRRLDLWLPSYLLAAPVRAVRRLQNHGRVVHIILLVCDHFEPRHGASTEEQPAQRVKSWHEGYAELQDRCRQAFGTKPVHTWFFPPHHGVEHLERMSDMVFDGLGEVELHYHHDGDTAETLARDLKTTVSQYNRWGFLLAAGENPRPAFGFIHGDWALNNSCGGKYCGVNNETDILRDLGCWGDFTMPSGNQCQTRKINSIYYANGDMTRPKSHNWGTAAAVGRDNPAGFFMMQGPLAINWRAPGYPRIENASLTSDNWGRPDRIRAWLDCQVQVKGRPDWLFIKLHAHGAVERDFDALFGKKAFEMHRILNTEYNDGKRFRLHYVTARQAFNIAKAAEAGKEGSPADWLDYCVPPQPHSFYSLDAPHDLLTCTPDSLVIHNIEYDRNVHLRSRVGPVEQIDGALSAMSIDNSTQSIRLSARQSTSEISLRTARGFDVDSLEGGAILERPEPGGDGLWKLLVNHHCEIKFRTSGAKMTHMPKVTKPDE